MFIALSVHAFKDPFVTENVAVFFWDRFNWQTTVTPNGDTTAFVHRLENQNQKLARCGVTVKCAYYM